MFPYFYLWDYSEKCCHLFTNNRTSSFKKTMAKSRKLRDCNKVVKVVGRSKSSIKITSLVHQRDVNDIIPILWMVDLLINILDVYTIT